MRHWESVLNHLVPQWALSDSASETQENENNSETAGSFDQAWENMLNDTLNDDESDQSEYEEDENDDFSRI